MRDHAPIIIDRFNGLWRRGDPDNTPLDHFSEAQNIQHIGNEIATRWGIGIHQTVSVPLSNVKRMYNYATPTGNTLIVMTLDGADGKIYHVVNPTTVYGPILTITGMTDFAFVPYAGRAYISPIANYVEGDLTHQKGMNGEFLYVYMGAGVAARRAAGAAPSGNITIANGAAGYTDFGLHVFGVVYETDSGYLSDIGSAEAFTTGASNSVSFGNISTSGDPSVTKRHIVATKSLPNYNGNPLGYQFFFIPNGVINDNTSTFINNVSFYDADLLEDASHLIDNYTLIPAGSTLSFYHNRLMVGGSYDNPSTFLVSEPGEPEAINQINGLLIAPPDGNPITNGAELRDVFYGFKRARTYAWIDNGDEPATWASTVIDSAIGCPVHGIATVLDSGSSSVDFLIVASFMGLMLFNGRYSEQPLSWKIEDDWYNLPKNDFGKIQIVNDPVSHHILMVTPTGELWAANTANGMNPKAIRWEYWTFARAVNTVAIVNIEEIILGMDLV